MLASSIVWSPFCEEAVGDVLVDAPVAVGGEEPELVLLDRSAFGDVEVPHLVQRVGRRQPLRLASARVVALQAACCAPEKNAVPLNWLPPSFGIMLARTPPADDFGVDGAGLVADFLEHHVVEVALHAAVALDAVQVMPSTWKVVSRPSDPCTVRSRFCMPEVPPTSGSASRAPGSIAPSVGNAAAGRHRVEHLPRLSTCCCTAL